MGFIFEIESISRLAKARIAVLDGKLLEGLVTVGATAELIHAGRACRFTSGESRLLKCVQERTS